MLRNKYFPIANNRERPSPESRVQTWSIINEPQLIIHRGRPPEPVRWHPRGTTHRDTGHIGPGQRSDDAWNSSWWTQFPDRFFANFFFCFCSFSLRVSPRASCTLALPTHVVGFCGLFPRHKRLLLFRLPTPKWVAASPLWGGFNFGNPVRRSLILHTGETVHDDDGAFFSSSVDSGLQAEKISPGGALTYNRNTQTHLVEMAGGCKNTHTSRHVTTMVYCGNNFSLSSISYNSLIFFGEASDFRPRHQRSDWFLFYQRILWKLF